MNSTYITPYALAKANAYGTEAYRQRGSEIGGLAKLQFADNAIHVVDLHFFPQRAEAAHFEFDGHHVTDFVQKLVKEERVNEVEQWASIFHTHPPDMSASMSGEDVSELKRFAQEQDAFSLIMPAARTHDKPTDVGKLRMHYACSGRMGKAVLSDKAVSLSYMTEQDTLAESMVKQMAEHYDTQSEADIEHLEELARAFTRWEIGLLPSEVEALQMEAKAAIPELIERKRTVTHMPARRTGLTREEERWEQAWINGGGYGYLIPGDGDEDELDEAAYHWQGTLEVGDWVQLEQNALSKYASQTHNGNGSGTFEDLRQLTIMGGIVTETDDSGAVVIDGQFIVEETDIKDAVTASEGSK